MKITNILTAPLSESETDYYQIIDSKTKRSVGKVSKNRRKLQNRADKLDNEYGGVRYIVKRSSVEP